MEARAGPDDPSDKRRERRMRVLKSARIIFNGGYTVFDCRVRNISTSGALLQLANSLGIPNRFEVDMDSSGKRRPCTVVWRTDTLIGIAFDDAQGQAA